MPWSYLVCNLATSNLGFMLLLIQQQINLAMLAQYTFEKDKKMRFKHIFCQRRPFTYKGKHKSKHKVRFNRTKMG